MICNEPDCRDYVETLGKCQVQCLFCTRVDVSFCTGCVPGKKYPQNPNAQDHYLPRIFIN